MGHRKGVFTGFYSPEELKKELQRRAATEHRTLSQEIVHRLVKSFEQEKRERPSEMVRP